MEIPRGEIFDTFAGEVNLDHNDGDTNGRDVDITESVLEDDRMEGMEPEVSRVNSADMVNPVEVSEEVGRSAGMEDAEMSNQSDLLLGKDNKIQNHIFDQESAVSTCPGGTLGCSNA